MGNVLLTMDEPKPLTPGEFRQVLNIALEASGSQGVIIFNLRALSPQKIRVVKEVFGRSGSH